MSPSITKADVKMLGRRKSPARLRVCRLDGCAQPARIMYCSRAHKNAANAAVFATRREGLALVRDWYAEMRPMIQVNEHTGCWEWQGHLFAGYATVWVREIRRHRVGHRLLYEQLRGAISDGLTLDHLCRVRSCVNPDHLEPVTERENILRGISPSAFHARRTECNYGHPLEPVRYTGVRDGRRRRCRTCALAYYHARGYHLRKARS